MRKILFASLLLLPEVASAHALGAITYQFPIPLWLYVVGGGLAVAASVPVAAWRGEPEVVLGRKRWVGGHRGWRIAAQLVVILLLLEALVAGLSGSQEFSTNPATVLIWVDFWVGLGIVSAFVGPVWDMISPFRLLGEALDTIVGKAPLRLPTWVGEWPAVILLLVWGWIELAWPGGSNPRTLSEIVLGYILLQGAAMALFGSRIWIARGELFSVFSRMMARVSPFEWCVKRQKACPADAHAVTKGELVGCVDCWLEAPVTDRRVRWRGLIAGAWRELPLLPGGGLFIVLLLLIIFYDGFSETLYYTNITGWLYQQPPLADISATVMRTLTMTVFLALLLLVFGLVTGLMGRRSFGETVRRYAPTLMPISAVYFAAHYLFYLLSYGQLTWKVILDPFETDWVPDLGVWTGYPHALPWLFQVAIIVAGHIVAIFAAHRIATRNKGPRRVWAQAPLILLMIAYTVLGLWILGQAYASA